MFNSWHELEQALKVDLAYHNQYITAGGLHNLGEAIFQQFEQHDSNHVMPRPTRQQCIQLVNILLAQINTQVAL